MNSSATTQHGPTHSAWWKKACPRHSNSQRTASAYWSGTSIVMCIVVLFQIWLWPGTQLSGHALACYGPGGSGLGMVHKFRPTCTTVPSVMHRSG